MLALAPRLFARCCRPNGIELGCLGEGLAMRALRARGWNILGRRVRTPFGEVDLVAQSDGRLVCAEVKTALVENLTLAAADAYRPGRRCDHRRLARQRRAGRFLAAQTGAREQARVDLIEVWVERGTGRARLCHHPDLRAPLGRAT